MPHTAGIGVMIVEDDVLQAMHVADVLENAGIEPKGPSHPWTWPYGHWTVKYPLPPFWT